MAIYFGARNSINYILLFIEKYTDGRCNCESYV